MQSTLKYDTADGGKLDVTRVGVEYDVNVVNAKGDTVATVRVSEARLRTLIAAANAALFA